MKKRNKIIAAISVSTLLLALSVYTPFAAEDTGFMDVSADAWYSEAVEYCTENKLMSGVGNSFFSPEGDMNRAMMASVLYRASASPAFTAAAEFSDAEEGAWYSSSISWAVENNLLSGYGNGVFGVNDPVTREQAAAILWRYMESPVVQGTIRYSDRTEISDWAAAAVLWAQENTIMNTRSGNIFAPKTNITRAELAFALQQCFTAEQPQNASAEQKENKGILIAYFSRVGNTDYPDEIDATTSASILVEHGERLGTTEFVANMIQKEVGGELYAIHTEEKYSVDFDAVTSRNHQEQADNAMLELNGEAINIENYDTIFIGYPVWASTAPMPVVSFLSQYDLSGKTIIPFCTHDGYGSGNSFRVVETTASNATVLEGIDVEAKEVSSAQNRISSWLEKIEIQTEKAIEDSIVSESQTAIRVIIGDTILAGILNDSPEAQQFQAMLPQTVPMSRFGDREYYGGIDGEITTESQGKYNFENGDITYCPQNNSTAIFFAQTDRPNLTIEIFTMGRITSDLSVFDDLSGREEIRFELAD